MPYILDADWIIQAFAGRAQAASTWDRLAAVQIFVSWVTVAEVYEGAFNSSNPQARLNMFRDFLRPYQVLSLNEPIVKRFAELRAFLRRRGQMISEFDVMLAATALHYDLTVLTFNVRHLQRIPDLRLYPPG
ncbi:MAG: type II toxin-antitoxin system VapC family toxin [Dehalococcoidia bacterium]